ncbi:MAG TPA: type II toxin-antitoxin system VapC family toxin [Sporichthya sp.]|nr:type II toxin-antitoxin system VapC family toxin [Sporichthya sp.]
MSYLLDTNVVSELRKSRQRIAPQLRSWAERQITHELSVSVITVMEIEIGVARVERRDDAQGEMLRRWFDEELLGAFEGRVLAIDLDVFRRAANLHVPDPRPERDALIAATALTHGLTVVTRNAADFEPLGVAVLNPWDEQVDG